MDAGTSFDGDVQNAFDNQLEYCKRNDAPITARIVRALRDALAADEGAPFLNRIRDWQGVALADGLPLRAAGALHGLHMSGRAPELDAIYAGEPADDVTIVRAVAKAHSDWLLPWLEGPPQTNEAGRSSGFAAGMLWLADQGLPIRFEPFEIGSSAGINLMMDRFAWGLGGVHVGAREPLLSFTPEWRGPPPPQHALSIATPVGCDVAPVDLTSAEQALRLKAYIWPEHTERFARLEAAIAEAAVHPPLLTRMHAADFVEQHLASPQAEGTTRVLVHSIVWQYLPANEKERITAAMEAAGARATQDRALAWIALEADRVAMAHGLQVRSWPGDGKAHRLAAAHAHGAWLEWLGA
ncbi:DUF2332 domain-containing protein [Novosphingobium sp. 9U]|uniref:DUF2332 domain-containing protein n=1 Tax=Novosphingobium sp. 9U TaxID=2653158 RepID=UPI0012F0CFAF|nr:DUF2332 domain-containing protein [Novosphingobium sp. 9U]VWX51414.1 conserved hypothetical protein [Novosphingobium sp. 9U]